MTDKILGHDWGAIQRAQRGGRLYETVDTSKPAKAAPTAADQELLAKYGSIEAIEAAGLFGVADRLRQ